jgi:DNA-3-methyladenine glycosylase
MKLTKEFYQRGNVVTIARELIGKQLFTRVNGMVTAGMIVETEAYSWKEKGCHAYGARITPRNEIMFANGGHAYVYLCYGMYNLFNIVTNTEGKADAVLIRALEPIIGVETMRERRAVKKDQQLTSGPGKLTKALGIARNHNGTWLQDDEVWVEEGRDVKKSEITSAKRIGIDYAEEDADLLWRFYLRENLWVSKKA